MKEIYKVIIDKHQDMLTELEEAVILHKASKIEKEVEHTLKKIDDIIDYWCSYYEVGREALAAGSRVSQLKIARYMIFWTIRKKIIHNNLTYQAIGKMFNRDHSTVLHGVKQVEDWILYDQELRQDLMRMLIEFGYRADWHEELQELNWMERQQVYNY